MNRYVIQFRPGCAPEGVQPRAAGAPEIGATAVVAADRVQGWSHDYAFFADADNPKEPLWIYPRDVVQSVWRADSSESSVGQQHYAVRYVSERESFGGVEKAFATHEAATEFGERLGRQGMTWWVEPA